MGKIKKECKGINNITEALTCTVQSRKGTTECLTSSSYIHIYAHINR